MPAAFAIAAAVQCVASCGGSALVSAITRSIVSAGSGGMRDGRVLSRASPSTPACMNRSCQRQMAVLSLPTARTMPFVPMPGSGRQQASANARLRLMAVHNSCRWQALRTSPM